MRKKLFSIFFAVFVGILFLSGCTETDKTNTTDETNATYEVTFTAIWSEETHRDGFPFNPHFSGLIGAAHNDSVTFWEVGEYASAGIRNMAENGEKNPLIMIIDEAISEKTAYKKISGGGINPSPGSVNLEFEVSKDYPLVTLVSMIAPSPDWFVGVESLNLFEEGVFVDKKIVSLFAYDAGTDNGPTYTSPDELAVPPDKIFKIGGSPFLYEDGVVSLGTFTFTKI